MKIIATRQNDDGSYDTVGTTNRTVFSHYKTIRGAIKNGLKEFGKGKVVKFEIFFDDNIYKEQADQIVEVEPWLYKK